MYFNFKITDLPVDDIFTVQLLYQNSSNSLSLEEEINKRDLSRLQEYITKTIKGKTILNKAGRELHDKITTSYEVNEKDFAISKWLNDEYLSHGKLGGNKKKMAYYIAAFRQHLAMNEQQIFVLIQEFIKDKDAFEWSKKAEKLLFNPGNPFRTKFDLFESPLYQYYERYKEKLDEVLEEHKD